MLHLKCNILTFLSTLVFFLIYTFFSTTLYATNLLTFKLEIKDGKFFPNDIIVPAKKKIKITIYNIGKTAAEFESTELRKEKVLAPGAKSFIVIAPLRAGKYKFFDDFHLNMPIGFIIAQ